ncbi:MAG: Flp family type IVb pilin [Nitrospirota bacterium]
MMDYILSLYTRSKCFMSDQKGQALVEYALILALIAVAVVAILGGLGTTIGNKLNTVNTTLSNAG